MLIPALDTCRRGGRGLRYLWWAMRSFAVLSWYRALYAGLDVGAGVRVGKGVYISVVKGARLTIGARTNIESHVRLVAEGELTIGADSFIGTGSIVVAVDSIRIGCDALIAPYVSILDHDHRFDHPGIPYRAQRLAASPTVLGDNVWLGTNVIVLRGVTIGRDVIVGANAVVTRDIAAGSIAVGSPAQVVRQIGDKLSLVE